MGKVVGKYVNFEKAGRVSINQSDVRNDESYNQLQEKKVKPQHEQPLKCPRCNSTNTKFCYYNNYSLTQPRYFCKACKRYWTKGGSLRSVPVGGGSRKNKRSVSSMSSVSKPIDLSQFSSQNFTTHEAQDLNLGYQAATQQGYNHHGFSQFLKIENKNANFLSSSLTSDGINCMSSRINPTNENPMLINGTRFGVQEFKPTMGFPFQGNGIKYGNFQGNQEENERMMFPFGVLNQQQQQHSSRENGEQGNSIGGYWNETSVAGGSSTLYN